MAGKETYGTIVVSPEPRGRFLDVIVEGTPLPGSIMQLKAATASVGGKFTYVVADIAASGDKPAGPIAVLLEDQLQGKTIDDAYVTGTLGRVYFPLPGDELLVLRADDPGNACAIGDIFMIEDATGMVMIASGTSDGEPFISMDAYADPSADVLTHVQFSGY